MIYTKLGIRGKEVEDMHFLSSFFWSMNKTIYKTQERK